jgi:uncharacterized RDD family membrane protein YckC
MPDWSARPQAQKLTFEPQSNVQYNGHTMLARPLDRLAAVIVDLFIVLGPIYILLSAPFKNWMTTNLLAGGGMQMESLIAGMFGIAVGLVVVYQTFFTYFFRGTLGKLLFDLRVQPMFEGERVSAWDCFIRSWLWIGEIALLGIPFLSIFSNSKRRPIHDRLCDTVVVARTNAGVKAPALWERGVVRGVFAILLTLGLMTLAAQLRGEIGEKVDSHFGAFEAPDSGACEVVSKDLDENAVEEDPGAPVDEHQRLSKAMTLYAAGLADKSCLEAEVEREMAEQVPVGPITYLAQAFVYADDPETSNSYLDEVCESAPESVECHMSQVVSKWSDEDWESVEEAITKAPKGSGYLEVWGVRHYMKQAQYGRALALLNSSLTERSLSEFAMVQRVKALFNSYREPEAESALMQAVSALPEESGHDLTAWVCAQQLQNGCSATETPACQHFQKDFKGETQEIDFEQTNAALAQVLTLECQNEGKIDYMSFQDAVQNDDWSTFFRANLKRQREDKGTAGELFSQLIMSPEAPELLKVEAARRWAQFADMPQLEDMIEQWRDLSSREVWVKEGNILFKRLAELHQPKLALKVANYLVQGESLSPQAIAALGSMVDAPQTVRTPASAKGKK